ncbi:MAG: potassium channel family protein [Jatrophihabitans sp.]|uniref:potassium channel family protein n=1 Tax=Jatrophihabitans sp. TaxID=1932789 RepID=UPI003F7E6803
MRVAVVGAGSVGRSIAGELLADGHRVLIIERLRRKFRPELTPAADWMLADACELGTVDRAGIALCDAVVAATGDDKANLVFSLLAKTQCGVPRVVARVNDAGNRWLFGPQWGVDVAVSTPSALVSLVEEAVTVGDLVELMTLQQGQGTIVAVTVAAGSRLDGSDLAGLGLPDGAVVVGVRRDGGVLVPGPTLVLQAGDELVLAASAGAEDGLRERLR